MQKSDPFGFNISAAADKKRRQKGRRGMSGAFETSTRVCDKKGCNEAGKYRAPKSPKILDDYFWFCKEHIREYNLNWNYFQGQSEEEFQEFLDNATVWERPTKPFNRANDERLGWSRHGISDPHEMLGENATQNPGRKAVGRKLPPTERKAAEILDVKDTASKSDVRKAYKALIKVLHPDMNGGDRSQEEILQEVVWAWDQLKDSRNFK
ncbi:J domain-containing protein [Rhodobacteraceae bacterium]|nr:J domain-containing protein [Paracoccaceae bacterium]